MAISEVIKFEGSPDELVWKFPYEDFNATSQLIVDETHEALLVINGNAADLFGAGRRTLTTGNIPLARKIIEIPSDGVSPFPCKVFFINKVHQMDLLWGTQGPIALEDPLYDIFMHVMAHGSMSISVNNSRKFMLKMVGFRDRFGPDELVSKFRGIISSYVKDSLSKIMITGMLSYFHINANLFDISNVIKEKLDLVLDEYGVNIEFFNIETIEVPSEDYEKVSEAKERRTSRKIEGYTWQEERQMMISEKFASNDGAMGGVGGAVGGFMVGGAMGGSIADIARNALDPKNVPTGTPPKDVSGSSSRINSVPQNIDVNDFFKPKEPTGSNGGTNTGNSGGISVGGNSCSKCHKPLPENAKFCLECGEKVVANSDLIECPSCQSMVAKGKFCLECGYKLATSCPGCGIELDGNAKFCMECGYKL